MELTSKKVKGYYLFYLDGKDVTREWMDFFSGLSPKQERKCVELFLKKKKRGNKK